MCLKQFSNKIFLAIIFGLLVFSFSACDEEKVKNDTEKIYQSTISVNSFDSLGLQHNELVDYYKCEYQTIVVNRFFYHDSTSYITMDCYNNFMNC